MDYKEGKHLSKEQDLIIRKFLKNRVLYLSEKCATYNKITDAYEKEQAYNYIVTNLSLYFTGVMCLYEDAILFKSYNNLTEMEKYKTFLIYFKGLIEKEKLYFLGSIEKITKKKFTDFLLYNFLSYEQNIYDFLKTVKKYNKDFNFSY